MAWGRSVALLLLVLATRGLGQRPHPEPGLPGLWHSYDCGVKGMQLLVLPGEGRAVRFKVMGECHPGLRWGAGVLPWNRKSRASLQPERGGPDPSHIGRRKAGSQPQFPWSPRQSSRVRRCAVTWPRCWAVGPGSARATTRS